MVTYGLQHHHPLSPAASMATIMVTIGHIGPREGGSFLQFSRHPPCCVVHL